MQPFPVFLMGLNLVPLVSGYTITRFSGRSCSGEQRRLNVPDNTCAPDNFQTRSARVESYGGVGQRARFGTECRPIEPTLGPWDAWGGDRTFRVGACIDFGGQVAETFLSLP
jgi:hypothetical protein